jgi:hypothetical protein
MPAKGKNPPEKEGPASDESLIAELMALTVAEDKEDDEIVKTFPDAPPFNVRGLMVQDFNGEYYAPQKGMFAYNPSNYYQVASVKQKLTDEIEEEKKKNPNLKAYRFKAVVERFPYVPTKVAGFDRGYMTKFFPVDGERRRKSPRRGEEEEEELL